jgi:hypothetical protein
MSAVYGSVTHRDNHFALEALVAMRLFRKQKTAGANPVLGSMPDSSASHALL